MTQCLMILKNTVTARYELPQRIQMESLQYITSSVCPWVLPSTETERCSSPSHEDIKFFQIGLQTPSHLYNAPHVFFLYIA